MDRLNLSRVTDLVRRIRTGRYTSFAEAAGIDAATLSESERELGTELDALNAAILAVAKESDSRDRLIIDSTPVAICITNDGGYYEYANPRYQELTGYPLDELTGRHFTLVVPDETRTELSDLHDKFMGRRYELSGQWAIVTKEGRRIPILASAAYVVDAKDEPKKITFVIDISEIVENRERLQHEVEERRRLEYIRDNVERVLQHDLRNPIDGIRTASGFLLQEDLDERYLEFIRLIHEAAGRARNRIDNSLAYTRMEQGRYEIERSRINVVQLVRDVVREIRDVRVAYRVEIVTRYRGRPLQETYDVELWGDAEFLHDALTNLVRNALEASEAGSEVVVEVDEFEGSSTSGAFVTIEVRNAADVPEEIRDRLFDPYVTYGKREGTGLGTYTAQLIARAHGGTITLETGNGEGTKIALVLPRGRIGDVPA
ncbi:MAG: two-component system sensor histidine kinase NtrB [Alkalispirochaeta sp.]